MGPGIGIVVLVLLSVLDPCQGHGRLRCPPGRSSMWRDGFGVPLNYQDNELNCGGRWTQWDKNGGKCGVCGDAYDAKIQNNQPPYGKFAKPILSQCYNNSSHIDAFIQITANHQGYVEFRLCPHNDFNTPVTQECLDRNVLNIRDSNGRARGQRYHVKKLERDIHVEVQVPPGMTCDQCVLQWRYVAGNSWGCSRISQYRRRCGIGYGPQESFFNCADIAILPDCGEVKIARRSSRSVCYKDSGGSQSKVSGAYRRGVRPPVIRSGDIQTEFGDENLNLSGIFAKSLLSNGDNKKKPETKNNKSEDQEKTSEDGIKPRTTSSPVTRGSVKVDTDAGQEKVGKAVQENSNKEPGSTGQKRAVESEKASSSNNENKPVELPLDTLDCYAIGIWSNIKNMNTWCRQNCRGGHCPSNMCACR